MAVLSLSRSTRAWNREIALALAAIMLIAAAPSFFAPTIRDSVPALTLDICHPLQSIGSPIVITLAGAPARWTASAMATRMPAPQRARQLAARIGESPDTPPPKPAA